MFAAIMLLSVVTFAQEKEKKDDRKARMSQTEKLTPEQHAELKVKKMTLELDLNQKQQQEIKTLFLENAKKREAKKEEWKKAKAENKKPTADERYKAQNDRLDGQIALKTELKKILTPEQMAKYEAKAEARKSKMTEKKGNRHKKMKKENKE